MGLLDAEPPNLARFVFTDARARRIYPDRDRVAAERAAALRAAASLGDVHAAMLAEELTITAGTRFRERFETSVIPPERNGVERWAHPDTGELRLAYESLDVSCADAQRLIVYLPADDSTTAALDHLTAPAPTP